MPIGAIGAVVPALPSLPTVSTSPANATPAANNSFGDMVSGAVESLDQRHATANDLATQAVTGDLTDVHDYLIAANEASVATELTVAVRDRAVQSFQSIMQMPV
jgi:flagellar hook-basal body complex protein FliE